MHLDGGAKMQSIVPNVSSLEYVSRAMNTNDMHILISFIGGLACLLPLFVCPTSHMEQSPLRNAMPSWKNKVGQRFIAIIHSEIFS